MTWSSYDSRIFLWCSGLSSAVFFFSFFFLGSRSRSCAPFRGLPSSSEGELSPPELLLLLAACEADDRPVINRPAANKAIPKKFLRIIGRLWASREGERKVWAPCWPSFAQALRSPRRARLFRHSRNEQGA